MVGAGVVSQDQDPVLSVHYSCLFIPVSLQPPFIGCPPFKSSEVFVIVTISLHTGAHSQAHAGGMGLC